VPGTQRSRRGIRRSIFICFMPVLSLSPSRRLGFSFFRKPSAPLSPPIEKPPIRVSFITSVEDIAQTIASHWSRRACSASRTGVK